MLKRVLSSIVFLVAFVQASFAQGVQMAEGMRSDGKIYVVVGVLLIIFIGLVVYLISIDKKLKKLEENS